MYYMTKSVTVKATLLSTVAIFTLFSQNNKQCDDDKMQSVNATVFISYVSSDSSVFRVCSAVVAVVGCGCCRISFA